VQGMRKMVKRICLALVIAVLARTASADSAPANGCAMSLPFVWDLAGSVSLAEPYAASLHRGGATQVWGTQNVRVEGSGSDAVIAVTYPEGSIDPASAPGAPLGGAGFLYPVARQLEHACLSYDVKLEPGFVFARGGKLPGLYGGDAPSGGGSADNGFTTRYMWRGGGRGEVYAYLPGKSSSYGESLGAGTWTFVPGEWRRIEQEIVLNRPDRADGVLRVWYDAKLVFEQAGLVFRLSDKVGISGLMFSTFFGGHDPSWASPRAQSSYFRRIRLHGISKT
jgi:hypothetical protein